MQLIKNIIENHLLFVVCLIMAETFNRSSCVNAMQCCFVGEDEQKFSFIRKCKCKWMVSFSTHGTDQVSLP